MPTPPNPPVIPSPEEVYDQLMGAIEPELLRANLSNLDALYAGDTEEQKKARAERYKQAFEKFYEEAEKFVQGLGEKAKQYYHKSLRTLEEEDRGKEEEAMNFDALVAAA